MSSAFYKDILAFTAKTHPIWQEVLQQTPPAEILLSPGIASISHSDLNHIQTFIKTAHRVAHLEEFQKTVEAEVPETGKKRIDHFSAFMSYDFHITPDGPKLIEINTNAAFSLWAYALTCFAHSKNQPDKFLGLGFIEDCKNMLIEEFNFQSNVDKSVAIVDDHPEKQRGYVEFLMYQELFKSWGWKPQILDRTELKNDSTFSAVYNRATDFYFEEPKSKALHDMYLTGSARISPNPFEYARLADKERLFQFTNESWLSKIGVPKSEIEILLKTIPAVFPMDSFDRLLSRSGRDKYFFKPRRSFGSKAVYRGKSMSQKIFEEILLKDYIAQELVEPPVMEVQTETGAMSFKWDLRVYTYKDQMQLLCARLFQGQMTNTQTLGGGLAPVRII